MVRIIVLLRHAKAGDREAWRDEDAVRPLTKSGKRQALLLAGRLAALGPDRIVSSPYRRCRQTVEPLAETVGLSVETSDALQEGAELVAALALIASVTGNAVLCSHGDVIGAVLAYLAAQQIIRPPLPPTEKGAYWLIGVDGETFVSARLVAAP